MLNYENATNIMAERFGKDSLIAIATTDGKHLSPCFPLLHSAL